MINLVIIIPLLISFFIDLHFFVVLIVSLIIYIFFIVLLTEINESSFVPSIIFGVLAIFLIAYANEDNQKLSFYSLLEFEPEYISTLDEVKNHRYVIFNFNDVALSGSCYSIEPKSYTVRNGRVYEIYYYNEKHEYSQVNQQNSNMSFKCFIETISESNSAKDPNLISYYKSSNDISVNQIFKVKKKLTNWSNLELVCNNSSLPIFEKGNYFLMPVKDKTKGNSKSCFLYFLLGVNLFFIPIELILNRNIENINL